MADNVRLVFSKTGRAKYISHLDMMHTFQRACYRAELPLRYTQGFNPHAYLSIALPLPVGAESICERLDLGLTSPVENLEESLNAVLPHGIVVHKAMPAGRSFSEIAFASYELRCQTLLPFDRLTEMFSKPLYTDKKTKKGMEKVEITSLIKAISFNQAEDSISAEGVFRVQNPTLNPSLIIQAVRENGDENAGIFFLRTEIYDMDGEVFEPFGGA